MRFLVSWVHASPDDFRHDGPWCAIGFRVVSDTRVDSLLVAAVEADDPAAAKRVVAGLYPPGRGRSIEWRYVRPIAKALRLSVLGPAYRWQNAPRSA